MRQLQNAPKDEKNDREIAKKRTNIGCFERGSAFFERLALYHSKDIS